MMNAMPDFVNSDDIWEETQGVFQRSRQDILRVLPGADVQHTGSTALRGALTKGDVDIQVRINKDSFENGKSALGKHYQTHRPELWTPSLALFHYDGEHLPVGIALVVAGSGQDEFDKLRDLFTQDPTLLTRYNQLKKSHLESPDAAYRAAKAAFFGPLGKSHLLNVPISRENMTDAKHQSQ